MRTTDIYGYGLVRPFRRAHSDFAAAGGAANVRAAIGQILGTRASSARSVGELPWRPEFGSRLHLLRHDRGDAATPGIAHAYVAEALRTWEPRARVTRVEVVQVTASPDNGRTISIRVWFDLVEAGGAGNRVLERGLETTIRVG